MFRKLVLPMLLATTVLPVTVFSDDTDQARLGALAEEKLGDAFDIREFHDRVLENGTLPLDMLRAQIENWLNNL